MCKAHKSYRNKKTDKNTTYVSTNVLPSAESGAVGGGNTPANEGISMSKEIVSTKTTVATTVNSKVAAGSAEADKKMGSNEMKFSSSRKKNSSNELVHDKKNSNRKKSKEALNPHPSVRSDHSLMPPPTMQYAKRSMEGIKKPSRNDPQYLTLFDVNDWEKDEDQFSAYMKQAELHQHSNKAQQQLKSSSKNDQLEDDVTQPSSIH